MKAILSILSLLFCLNTFAQLNIKLDNILKSETINRPGIALMIEENGRIIYQKAEGIANDSTKQALAVSSNFRMASVSKQFTAIGILLLEKEGKLSFNDPVRKYLPELPATCCNKILIKHLLTHSSGLWDYEALIPASQATQLSDADVLKLLQTQDSTYFTPGEKFRYSNSGFCLLALIIERISHQSFASFIKEKIFTPLHMDASVVYEAGKDIQHRAMGYAKDSTGNIIFSDQSITSATKGDGGVYTSLTDYHKWIHALQQNKLINLTKVMERLRFKIADTDNRYYAAGWFNILSSPEILFHSGSTCGFNNFVIFVPERKLSIVYFSNLADNLSPFEKIITVLKDQDTGDFSNVLVLHQLTR